MNNREFLIWLQGFLEGQNISLTEEQVKKIESKLPSKFQVEANKLDISTESVGKQYKWPTCNLLDL